MSATPPPERSATPVASAPARPLPLRGNRDFGALLGSQAVSALGDAVSFTALPLLVLAVTGSGLAMGIVGALQTLPDLVFGMVAGALADRGVVYGLEPPLAVLIARGVGSGETRQASPFFADAPPSAAITVWAAAWIALALAAGARAFRRRQLSSGRPPGPRAAPAGGAQGVGQVPIANSVLLRAGCPLGR